MTDSETPQPPSGNGPHDLLGHLHEYHLTSPTLEYSYFTGEPAESRIPHAANLGSAVPAIGTTAVPTVTTAQSIYNEQPVYEYQWAGCGNETPAQVAARNEFEFEKDDLISERAAAPQSEVQQVSEWSESAERDRWIAFAQNEKSQARLEMQADGSAHAGTSSDGMRFSGGFNFHESLAKIFWRTDADRSNRLDQAELTRALHEQWFQNDEAVLVRVLLHHYDQLVPSRTLADGGVSIGQILENPLFKGMADEHMQRLCSQKQTGTQKKQQTTERLRLPNLMGRR